MIRGNFTRRGFLYRTCLLAGASCSYAFGIEPKRIVDETSVIPCPSLNGDGLDILHLTDFHADRSNPYELIEAAIEMGLARQPDLICLTGDFVTTHVENRRRYVDLLKTLSSEMPTYACLGNHDGGPHQALSGGYRDTQNVASLLRDGGVTPLINENTGIRIKGNLVSLTGLGDLLNEDCKPELAFANDSDADIRIVLSHNPDSKSLLKPYSWDLMLSGHTHGGQLRIPLVGAPLAPVKDKQFVEGLHRWSDRWIYISRGVGSKFGMRINCPPEVSLLKVRPA